jgi:hypothetical protein
MILWSCQYPDHLIPTYDVSQAKFITRRQRAELLLGAFFMLGSGLAYSSVLKMEVCSSGTSVDSHWSTWHIPEDRTPFAIFVYWEVLSLMRLNGGHFSSIATLGTKKMHTFWFKNLIARRHLSYLWVALLSTLGWTLNRNFLQNVPRENTGCLKLRWSSQSI